ncbi:MAG: glycosyltransferase family 39 protein, partial [Anaerolineae bacterium]|nr:glycosyltransferase family 39 protein [Anaerolineae bacterium]
MSNRTSYLLAVLLLLLTTFLRLWQITTLPIGFSNPELHQIDLMQDRTLQGEIRVFYETQDGGQEGLYQMLLALTGVAFGTGTMGLRLLSVFASLLTVALMYSLGVRLFGRWAGVAAAAFLSANLLASLLARVVLVQSLLPLLFTAVLLSLARAFPVYQRLRAETSNTIDFAALGTLLGIGLYLHPMGILLVLVAMLFIVHILSYRARISLRRISYIGFSLLMLIIISMPYLISSARLPELAAGQRILGDYQGLLTATWRSLGGIFLVGDHSVLLNVSQRPLIDLVSGFLLLIGLALCIRYWRHARYALPLLAGLLLFPAVVLAGDAPNFTSMSMLLPVLALYFGLGFSVLLRAIPQRGRWLGVLGALGLLVFNVGWVGQDLFVTWPEQDGVYEAYNGRVGQIAHRIDTTADDIPTVLCYPNWNMPHMPGQQRTAVDRILLHMNRNT